MKWLLRIGGGLLALLVVVIGLEMIAAESGEVVVLTTTDAESQTHETRLWVVEHEGETWLRSGGEIQSWYQRLRERPEVALERNGQSADYTAVPVPEARPVINDLMREKYGWADAYIGMLFGRDDAVPIRLDPRRA